MPYLYVLVGPPGVGKSTWREKRMVLWNHETRMYGLCPLVTISQDDLVEEYAKEHGLTYSQAFKQANLKEFDRTVRRRFQEAVAAGESIILDRTNMSRKSRRFFLEAAKDYKRVAVVFEHHPAVLDDRLDRRAKQTGKVIPFSVMRQMLRSYQEPTVPEFDEIRHDRCATLPTLWQRMRYGWRKMQKIALV